MLIDAIMTAYGMTKAEAEAFARKLDDESKAELIRGFTQTAKQSFYND